MPPPSLPAAALHHPARRNGPLKQVIMPRPYRPHAARCLSRRTTREKFNLRVFLLRCRVFADFVLLSLSFPPPLSSPFPSFSSIFYFQLFLSISTLVEVEKYILLLALASYTRPTQPPTHSSGPGSNVYLGQLHGTSGRCYGVCGNVDDAAAISVPGSHMNTASCSKVEATVVRPAARVSTEQSCRLTCL